MKKGKLDYLLNGTPHEMSTWIELCLCKTNPMFETYLRKEYEIIDREHALKIVSAERRDVELEWHGHEYAMDWNGNSLPSIPEGKARLWCIVAWKLTENHNRELRAAHKEDDRKRTLVIGYFTGKLGLSSDEAQATADALPSKAIESLLPMAEEALAQLQKTLDSSDDADASAILNGMLDTETLA